MKSFDAHRLSPSVKLALLQLRCAGLLLSLLAFFPGMAFAQAPTWPAKPIKILVPFAPGGNTDSIARIMAERLTQNLGQSVLVENKVGAGGGIAAEFVGKAAPDGYTLLMAAMPVMAILPAINKTNYDPVRDFVPISNVGSNPFVMGCTTVLVAGTMTAILARLAKLSKLKGLAMTYSIFNLAALAASDQMAMSARKVSANSRGVLPMASTPICCNRAVMPSEANTSLTASATRCTTVTGVPAGAIKPFQVTVRKPVKPDSAIVATWGS